MSVLEDIFAQLEKSKDLPIVQEIRDGQIISVNGGELLEMVGKARAFISTHGLKKGDRCGLLAHNGIRWAAIDLAMMAEGAIVVPLYARQSFVELVAMMRDSSPVFVCCEDAALRDGIHRQWPEGPECYLFDQIFASHASAAGKSRLADSDPVTIIYTSGTSGEPKGVVLTAGNVKFMLGNTSGRLDILMQHFKSDTPDGSGAGSGGATAIPRRDQVFHYLPFCFAASWLLLLTCLLRGSRLALATDLTKLAGDMRLAEADYFLNVPALLERMRKGIDEQMEKTGGAALMIYRHAKAAWTRKQDGRPKFADGMWLSLANSLVFPTIRKKLVGKNLKALISGSAPLNLETQLFFTMLGIPVLQAYGLTETTGICTLDDPRQFEPGHVGPAIDGIEMKLAENDEIVVRGPNVFAGYWSRSPETAKALRDGWFHTGDQGEISEKGNWRIIGRLKNLIILGSGHNIAPEPIEDKLREIIPGAQQVVLVGNGRGYLSALVTGSVSPQAIQAAIDQVNAQLPHYKQVRAYHVHAEPFSVDNGLLTVNGKLKRDQITARLDEEIESIYRAKQAS